MKSTLGFIIFALVLVGLLFFLSPKKYPPLPKDKVHVSITDASACFACHGPGKQYKLKPSHPPKFECFKCHEPQK
jgi:hypothetical protein